jgi:hypothetical protein
MPRRASSEFSDGLSTPSIVIVFGPAEKAKKIREEGADELMDDTAD